MIDEEKGLKEQLDEDLRQERKLWWRRFRQGIGKKMVLPLVIIGVVGFLLLALNYFFRLENLDVTGSTHYSTEEFRKKIVTNPLENNALYLYLEYKYFKNPEIPFVQKMDMEMLDGHELLVTVYEKSMTACVKYMSEYLYFDKDGIVVESSPELLEDLPVVEGVSFSKMTLYEPLQVKDDDIFETILDLTQMITQYELPIRRIVFNTKSEVTMYSGKIKITLGDRENYAQKFAQLSQILPKARKNNLSGTLDLTDYKEGQSRIILKEEKN